MILLKNKQYEFSVLDGMETYPNIFKFRYKIYVEEYGYEKHNKYGIEYDKLDLISNHFILKDIKLDKMIGYFRSVPSIEGVNFISRFCILKETRSEKLFSLLSYLIVKQNIHYKINRSFALISAPMIIKFQACGINIKPLDSILKDRILCELDTLKSKTLIQTKNNSLFSSLQFNKQ